MDVKIPNSEVDLNIVNLQKIDGFRAQEAWGRWTIGKVTKIEFLSQNYGWVVLNVNMTLPYSNQNVKVLFNGTHVFDITSRIKDTVFARQIPINLISGKNTIEFLTDKSNLDGQSAPFAPNDKTDMGVSFRELNILPLDVFTENHAGKIYGAYKSTYPSTYKIPYEDSINVFSNLTGQQSLNYRILTASNQETIKFLLNGQIIYSRYIESRGTLAVGQINLDLSTKPNRLSLVSKVNPYKTENFKDSISTFERFNSPANFYIQKIDFTQRSSWDYMATPLASLIVVLVLVLMFLFLFNFKAKFLSRGQKW